jgi:hypothetical protein
MAAQSRVRVERYIRMMVGSNIDLSMLGDDAVQDLAAFIVSNLRNSQ